MKITAEKDPVALCLGDVMLDIFSDGHVHRLSPEAPVPVLQKTRDRKIAGGAANVARNFAALGGSVHLMGVIGEDASGDDLMGVLQDTQGLQVKLVRDGGRRTIVKQRFTASGHQMLRVDSEDSHALHPDIEAAIIAQFRPIMSECDIILVSDYAKGLVTPTLMAAVNAMAQARNIPVLVDPKRADWSVYGACTIIKPNAKELSEASGLPTTNDDEVEAALRNVKHKCGAQTLIATRAEKGMSALVDGRIMHRAGQAKEVYDVSGAGDTVLAALGYGLAKGQAPEEAMDLAIRASGIVVGKQGTAVVDQAELNAQETSQVFGSFNALAPQLNAWRHRALKIGFTNGCFDILHPGHLRILERTRAKCDRLIVGLNSDGSVARLKGASRPVNTQEDRARLLAGLSAVDAVVIFEDDTPAALIEAILPDLLSKGGDYTANTIVGASIVQAKGGEVLIIPLIEGKSTTNIISKSSDKS